MTVTTQWRGHEIEETDEGWVYSDTKMPCSGERECGVCGLESTPEGHDGCIGTLPGVMNACCGHGGTYEGAYVQFNPNVTIRGQEAIDYIKEVKKCAEGYSLQEAHCEAVDRAEKKTKHVCTQSITCLFEH